MEYIFQVCEGVRFLVKLQAFLIGLVLHLHGCAYNRFVQGYYRAQNTRFYKKQV